MIYGYARVSTKQQNLQLQLNSLREFGCDKIFAEKITGDYRKNKKREQLDKLLSVIKSGDTLVVWKLDRLSRTLQQTVNVLEFLLNNNINFKSISDNFDTTTSYGRALLYMAAIFAQLEVDLISERTIEGLEAARLQGRVGGRKPISSFTQSTMYQMYYSGDYSISQICKECNISHSTLYKYLHLYDDNPETLPQMVTVEKVPPQKIEKKSERKCGRPTLDKNSIKRLQEMYADPKYTVNDILKELHISRTTFYKYYK